MLASTIDGEGHTTDPRTQRLGRGARRSAAAHRSVQCSACRSACRSFPSSPVQPSCPSRCRRVCLLSVCCPCVALPAGCCCSVCRLCCAGVSRSSSQQQAGGATITTPGVCVCSRLTAQGRPTRSRIGWMDGWMDDWMDGRGRGKTRRTAVECVLDARRDGGSEQSSAAQPVRWSLTPLPCSSLLSSSRSAMSVATATMPLHQRAMHTIIQILQQALQHAQGKLPPWAPAAAAAFIGQPTDPSNRRCS